MNKMVYIIPGYQENYKNQRAYKKIQKFFEARNILVKQVDINWGNSKRESFKSYIQQFYEQYKKPRNAEVYVVGFSFGAMIGFLTAAKVKPKVLILCSLSPYFIEDYPKLKPNWLKFWRNTFSDSAFSFNKIAKKLTIPIYLIVGDKEDVACIQRAKAAKRSLVNSKLVIAKGAKHNVGQKEYLASLEQVINKLN